MMQYAWQYLIFYAEFNKTFLKKLRSQMYSFEAFHLKKVNRGYRTFY